MREPGSVKRDGDLFHVNRPLQSGKPQRRKLKRAVIPSWTHSNRATRKAQFSTTLQPLRVAKLQSTMDFRNSEVTPLEGYADRFLCVTWKLFNYKRIENILIRTHTAAGIL